MDSLHTTMGASALLSLALFAFVNSITPGPNNVMLTASGATFGYRPTLPHMLGISLGTAGMLLVVGAGLGTLFTRWPQLYHWLQVVGAVYLLWLAYKIAQSGQVEQGAARAKPFTFWQAAAFQWVNPKAWIMTVGIVAAYTPQEGFVWNLLLATLILAGVNFPCISVWTLFGSAVGRALRTQRSLQYFNWLMAFLLVLSLLPIAQEWWQAR